MEKFWSGRVVMLTLLFQILAGGKFRLIFAQDQAVSTESLTLRASYKTWLSSMSEKTKVKGIDSKDVKPGPFFDKNVGVVQKSDDTTLYVDSGGNGQFKKVQDAVDAIASDESRTNRVVIKISEGVYYEQVIIGEDKPYVTLQGSGLWNTKISWQENLGQSGSDVTDAAAQISGDHFTAVDISFENTSPAPPSGAVGMQATALSISGDKAAFVRVGFFGHQDTLYDRYGRHYFQDSYVTGSIDFIYGDGQSYYTGTQLAVQPVQAGSLTAQKRKSKKDDTGYSFVGCGVTGEGYVYLGRAWGPASRTVFSHSYLADLVNPVGWNDWGLQNRDKTVFFGEYQNYGPGASQYGRANFGRELSDDEAGPFQTVSFIDGEKWLPDAGIGGT